MKHNRKLKSVLGKDFSMSKIPESEARPGAWKSMLKSPKPEAEMNKHNHVPAVIQDKIVEEVANGSTAKELETKYHLRDGYVRDALIRKYGSIDGMKKALKAQCFENAIALNTYAMERINMIPPGQALMGVKVMIDSGLALEKSSAERPPSIDFGALTALGSVLERVEKQIGSDTVREV